MIVLLQHCRKLGILYQHVALYFTFQNVALCVRNSLNWLTVYMVMEFFHLNIIFCFHRSGKTLSSCLTN